MLKRMTLAILITSLAFAGTPVQDSALNHFPDNTSLLVEVDMAAMLDMVRQLQINDLAEQMTDGIVEDLLNKIDTVYVGLPEGEVKEHDSLYVLMRSDLSVQELIDLAVKYDDEDHDFDIQSTAIGPFKAYFNAAQHDDEEDDMFIAEADGFLVAGSREGLLQYADVRSGKIANARGNESLVSLRRTLPSSSSVRIYGTTPAEMGRMFNPDTIALGIGTIAENLNMHLRLSSGNVNELDKLEKQINGLSGMVAMLDETGELSELLESLEVVRENDAITMHMDIPLKKLQSIISGRLGGVANQWH